MSLLTSLPKSDKPGILYDADVVHGLLPQKAPFAFVDDVLSLDPGSKSDEDGSVSNPSIVVNFHLTGEEDFFKGHFPGNPVMPGVLQIEALAQAATLLTQIAKEKDVAGMRPAFLGVEQCRFKSPVVPPSTLTIKVTMLVARRCVFKYTGEILQGETLVCKADFSAAMI